MDSAASGSEKRGDEDGSPTLDSQDTPSTSDQGTTSWPSKRERRRRRNHEVWLHIYDLDPVTARLNEYLLRSAGLGAFHCGVEILYDEWFFAWGESSASGVLCNEPRGHQVHIYRESLNMGQCPLTEDEIKTMIGIAMDEWPANSYHPITRNCAHFAEALCGKLQVPEPFPEWVKGAADAGKNPVLFPVADFGWRWVKWWCTEGTEEGTQAAVADESRDDAGTSGPSQFRAHELP